LVFNVKENKKTMDNMESKIIQARKEIEDSNINGATYKGLTYLHFEKNVMVDRK